MLLWRLWHKGCQVSASIRPVAGGSAARPLSGPFRAERVSTPRVLGLRVASIVFGAATFGALATPSGSAGGRLSTVGYAAGFAAAMLIGAGWRVLAAVALADPRRRADATWAGAAGLATLFALLAASAASGGAGPRVLAAAAIALGVAFVFARAACVEAGCCRARTGALAARGVDLRGAEIAAGGALVAASAVLYATGAHAAAALVGFGGHLAIRLVSRHARADWPGRRLSAETLINEIAPLAIVTCVAAAAAARGWS